MIRGGRFGRIQCLNARFFQTQILLSIDSAEAIEKQLADISERDGVAARDAFQSDLLNQISEKAIDRGGVAEVGDGGEEFGCGGFASALALQAALSMIGAEVRRWSS